MKNVNLIRVAKKSADIQISELKKIKKIFNKSFLKAVETIINCKGKVITAGIGKSGLIARKVSATLSSVGISSFYLNPGEANHGDLGQIDKRDVLLVFSYSGNTSEINNMLKYANRFNIPIIGVASKKNSILLNASNIKILLPTVTEADPTKMVPTSSTSITLLFGDCLAVALMNKIKFSKDKFKIFHPGGNIGNSLLTVKDIMISGNKLPLTSSNCNIQKAIKIINQKNLGIVIFVKNKIIKGVMTDGDARRGLKYFSSDTHVGKFMTKNPFVVDENTSASKALSIMNEKKITSLIVHAPKNKRKVIGLVHIHSLLKFGVK
ncbi:MAG: hypothetical protein CBD76_02445 [Pelagibacteraceae bacterium TMED216]|nr:MAG: hypothetical protein CBD76_02445 [Pelagibacteraceae bacterium TMED216]|tara:strand:+ start:1339 stop:2304 length:966 start_codon:yes stop_codon:yes gene_type:complete